MYRCPSLSPEFLGTRGGAGYLHFREALARGLRGSKVKSCFAGKNFLVSISFP